MKKPLILYIEHKVINTYKLPKGHKILVVDLDLAKKLGEKTTALRWMKRASAGEKTMQKAPDLLWPWAGWYEA